MCLSKLVSLLNEFTYIFISVPRKSFSWKKRLQYKQTSKIQNKNNNKSTNNNHTAYNYMYQCSSHKLHNYLIIILYMHSVWTRFEIVWLPVKTNQYSFDPMPTPFMNPPTAADSQPLRITCSKWFCQYWSQNYTVNIDLSLCNSAVQNIPCGKVPWDFQE